MIVTILVLILILGVLVFVHELGHFIAAKMIGVYVHEFAIGMGPKLFSFKRKNKNDPTVYSVRLLPIGGFCAMAGENEEDATDLKLRKDQYMCNRSKFERFLILAAGVTNNIILAIIILFFQALIWGTTEQRSIVGNAQKGYPISEAGIEVGDRVLAVNGHKVNTWDKLTIILNLKHDKDTYEFEVKKKDGEIKKYTVTPKKEVNEDGSEVTVFGIGADSTLHKGFGNAVKYAFTKLGSIVSSMWIILGSLFTGKLALNNLAGPVGMYSVVGETMKYGLVNILYLMAYLSVNLAVINALPFPAFDGGRIFFVLIEAIRGKKIDQKVEGIIHTIGFALLMLLMIYITIQDIIRLVK